MTKICTKCDIEVRNEQAKFCAQCGTELQDKKELPLPDMDALAKEYHNSHGTWTVTTEGDCEGRTTRHLGTYIGHIDDIARALAHRTVYGLSFTHSKTLPPVTQETFRKSVDISFDYTGMSGDISREMRAAILQQVLDGRPVTVSPSTSYNSITLEFDGGEAQ